MTCRISIQIPVLSTESLLSRYSTEYRNVLESTVYSRMITVLVCIIQVLQYEYRYTRTALQIHTVHTVTVLVLLVTLIRTSTRILVLVAAVLVHHHKS